MLSQYQANLISRACLDEGIASTQFSSAAVQHNCPVEKPIPSASNHNARLASCILGAGIARVLLLLCLDDINHQIPRQFSTPTLLRLLVYHDFRSQNSEHLYLLAVLGVSGLHRKATMVVSPIKTFLLDKWVRGSDHLRASPVEDDDRPRDSLRQGTS